jgi:carbonic anhydrase
MTVILTCMEHTPNLHALGLEHSVVDIVQNGGGVPTTDAVAALRISRAANGTSAVVVVHHTGCVFLALTDEFQLLQIASKHELDIATFADVALATAAAIDVLQQSDALEGPSTVSGAVWDERRSTYQWIPSV